MRNPSELAAVIGKAIGATLQPQPIARVHGGSINECHRWQSSAGPLFVKVAPAAGLGMLEAEAEGLEELRRANAVRVPRVLGVATTPSEVALALEWIELGGASRGAADLHGAARGAGASRSAAAMLGEQLAAQHRVGAAAFGWHRDNTIGSTPQANAWCNDWVTFFRERRLRPQLELARANGFHGRLQERGEAVLGRLDRLLPPPQEAPALLHGDLWGGNWATDERGAPVIFDPAVYFGDRLADIAMTRLFGGFGADFHAAYAASWPLPPEAETRMTLYNLYHVLNHLNLFGGGYLGQALSSMERLLS
jgi:protein-ribulosamine 3-kinase